MKRNNRVFKIAAIQMISFNDKKVNLEKAKSFIERAVREKAKVIVLPEHFNFSGKDEEKRQNAEPIPGPTINQLAELAKKFKIYLVCGSILEKVEQKDKHVFYNTSVFLSPEGKILAKYRKLHLFDVILPDGSCHRESDIVTPGNHITIAKTPLAIFGFTICYDLRFPELYRKLCEKGAQIVFIPSAFTLQTGKDHWEPLIRARAIENQFYIVAPNQFGQDQEGKKCWGKSMIVDPWGIVLSKATERETVIFGEVDLDYQEKIRRNMPCLSHKRQDLFVF